MKDLVVGNKFSISPSGIWWKQITEIVKQEQDRAIVRYIEDDGRKGISHMVFENNEWRSWIETPDHGQELNDEELTFMFWSKRK